MRTVSGLCICRARVIFRFHFHGRDCSLVAKNNIAQPLLSFQLVMCRPCRSSLIMSFATVPLYSSRLSRSHRRTARSRASLRSCGTSSGSASMNALSGTPPRRASASRVRAQTLEP